MLCLIYTPNSAEKVFSFIYGDFMELPPEKKSIFSHGKVLLSVNAMNEENKVMIKIEFAILRLLCESSQNIGNNVTIDILSELLDINLNKIREAVYELQRKKYIDPNFNMTEEGKKWIRNFEVKNAIILAAGMSTRFVPFSIERPKGLTVVKGEVLIERQIRQLKEAGVDEIVLVLGHMMEKFLYLIEKYNVKVVINNEYRYKNTHSSLYVSRDYLVNTYVCCADNFFPNNIFHKYEYHSIYSTEYMPGIWRGERGVITNEEGLIVNTQRPAVNQWVMNGYAYFNREFSAKFKKILEEIYDAPGTNELYWEQVYAEHVEELPLYAKRYSNSEILEFDTIPDLEAFDPDYIKYNDLNLIHNICSVLNCSNADIHNIVPLPKGYTNKSFTFECRDKKYVYREPGRDTEEFIDRKTEKRASEIAKNLGINGSYIYESDRGWMISQYVDFNTEFDFSNENHLKLLCQVFHKLFDDGYSCGRIFDYLYETRRLLEKLKHIDADSYTAACEKQSLVAQIDREIKGDGWKIRLTHNDVYEDNLLMSNDRLYLIDWEFAGDSDCGFDLCKLIVKNHAIGNDIDSYLRIYYGRIPTDEERRHIVGCAAVSFYYWYVWALYMVKKGKEYSNLVLDYYSVMNTYIEEYQKL